MASLVLARLTCLSTGHLKQQPVGTSTRKSKISLGMVEFCNGNVYTIVNGKYIEGG